MSGPIDAQASSLITVQWSAVVCRKPTTPATGVRNSWDTMLMNSSRTALTSCSRRCIASLISRSVIFWSPALTKVSLPIPKPMSPVESATTR